MCKRAEKYSFHTSALVTIGLSTDIRRSANEYMLIHLLHDDTCSYMLIHA